MPSPASSSVVPESIRFYSTGIDLTLKIVAANFCLKRRHGFPLPLDRLGTDDRRLPDDERRVDHDRLRARGALEPHDRRSRRDVALPQAAHRPPAAAHRLLDCCHPGAGALPPRSREAVEGLCHTLPWFIGAFITPLLVMLAVNLTMLYGVEDVNFQHYPSPLESAPLPPHAGVSFGASA